MPTERVVACLEGIEWIHTAKAIGEGGETSTEDHDQTSDGDGNLPAEVISKVRAVVPVQY